jgi:hypothetical protein
MRDALAEALSVLLGDLDREDANIEAQRNDGVSGFVVGSRKSFKVW